jgi:Zn finger protein HypA/HybF involved in hydrogenase expression
MLKFAMQHAYLRGKNLANCSNCGEKIVDDAFFCPKCGTKTAKGRVANAAYPAGELRDAFYSVGIELEKAFNIAARETHSAIQKAKENWQQKPAQPETVACSKCSTKNPSGSIFCNSCGNRIAPIEESHGSA